MMDVTGLMLFVNDDDDDDAVGDGGGEGVI